MGQRLPDRPLLDDEAGPLVRPYAVAKGRVTAERSDELEFITLVTATGSPSSELDAEHRAILRMSATPISIAELSGLMKLPAMVVKVLVSDLLYDQAVTVQTPELSNDLEMLEALLVGLQQRL